MPVTPKIATLGLTPNIIGISMNILPLHLTSPLAGEEFLMYPPLNVERPEGRGNYCGGRGWGAAIVKTSVGWVMPSTFAANCWISAIVINRSLSEE